MDKVEDAWPDGRKWVEAQGRQVALVAWPTLKEMGLASRFMGELGRAWIRAVTQQKCGQPVNWTGTEQELYVRLRYFLLDAWNSDEAVDEARRRARRDFLVRLDEKMEILRAGVPDIGQLSVCCGRALVWTEKHCTDPACRCVTFVATCDYCEAVVCTDEVSPVRRPNPPEKLLLAWIAGLGAQPTQESSD